MITTRFTVKCKNLIFSLLLVVSTSLPISSNAGWFDDIVKTLSDSQSNGDSKGSVSNGDITSAFKETLTIASGKVVSQLSQAGGFNKDPAIHIPLPKQLKKAKSLMEQVGMGSTFNELEVKLNQAAENATPQAKALFVDAVKKMSFDDIRQIYNGPADSATRYFQSKMTSSLSDAMSPLINNSLSEVGALQRYDDMISAYKTIPFVPDLKANLTEHVVDGAMKGIFHYLAEQEAAIRKDPVQQTTALLRKVFGQ